MSWLQRTALILSLSSLLIFGIALTTNWVQGPGIENLAGELKSSDLFQHYAAGVFWHEGKKEALYQGGNLGLWISQHHRGELAIKKSAFNYVYPPLLAWLSAGLVSWSFLSYALIWMGLSLVCYLVAARQLVLPTRSAQTLFWLILLLGLPSLHYTLILGQNSCLSLLIISSAAFLLNQQRDILAGLILSCLFYKPQFLPLLLGFMFLAGHYRMVFVAGLGFIAWSILGLFLCGGEPYSAWIGVLQKLNSGEQLQYAELNQTLKMFVLNLLGQASHPGQLSGLLTTLLGLALMILVALRARRADPSLEWNASHSLLLASAVMTVASPYLMHYDLLLACAWWIYCLQKSRTEIWKSYSCAALFWLISLFSINLADWPAPATAPLMLIYLAATIRIMLPVKSLSAQPT
jgi:hypothetical protein